MFTNTSFVNVSRFYLILANGTAQLLSRKENKGHITPKQYITHIHQSSKLYIIFS